MKTGIAAGYGALVRGAETFYSTEKTLNMDMVFVLEDGAVFRGVSFGAEGEACGWVHDDHRVVGYQEILTDPDNAGCLVNMTYPLIGNYGTNGEDSESGSVQAGALIVKEKSRIVSNWRATDTLEKMMQDGGVIGMEKVDTRALSLYIRDHGEMKKGLTDLPTISIVTHRDLLFGPTNGIYVRREDFNHQPVNAEMILPDGSTGFNIDCVMEIVGGTSPDDAGAYWKSRKLSLRMMFKGEYGRTGLDYQVFPDSQ